MDHRIESAFAPLSELERRVESIQAGLTALDLDGALFLHNTALIYLSGTIQTDAVFVPRKGIPLIMARNTMERARMECAWPEVRPLGRWADLRRILEEHTEGLRSIGLELDILSVAFFRRLTKGPLSGPGDPGTHHRRYWRRDRSNPISS